MKKLKAMLVLTLMSLFFANSNVFAEESRTNDGGNNYILEIDNDGLGSDNNDPNSTDQTSSYKLTGALESFDSGYGDTTGSGAGDYRLKSGLQPTFEAHVPEISIFSSTDGSAALYDRLLVEIDPNDNPTTADGALFALQISIDPSFSSFNYINPNTFQKDTVTNSDLSIYYKPCAQTTSDPSDDNRWDCGNVVGLKRYISNLAQNTTYYIRAVAKNGDFTNSEPGPAATSITQTLTATFSLSTNTSTFGILSPITVKSSTPNIVVTANTNSQYGYAVYLKGQGDGASANSSLFMAPGQSIPSVSGLLSAGTSGYGVQAASTSGSAEIDIDYNVVGNNVGQISRTESMLFSKDPNDPGFIVEEDIVTVISKSTININTLSGNYSDTLTFTMQVSPF